MMMKVLNSTYQLNSRILNPPNRLVVRSARLVASCMIC